MFADRYLRWESGPAGSISGSRRSLLWPVHVWTIMAPDHRSSDVNVLQEAILGLIQTGLRDADEIAALLDLDPDLVRFIVGNQLQPSDLVDDRLALTPAGGDALRGTRAHERRLVAQYAFQDALTGNWLPRFSRDLPDLLPVGETAGGRPEFLLSRDSGHRIRPYVLPGRIASSKPDKSAAIAALQEFQLLLTQQSDAPENDAFGDLGDGFDFVASPPHPAFVWCEVYVSPADLQPWLVSDPWRVTRAARWLREPLMAHLSELPGLARSIAELVPAEPDQTVTAEEWLKGLELKVDLELEELRYLRAHPLLREHVARLLRQLRRLEGQDRVHPEEVASLAQESMSVVEALFKWMLERWSVDVTGWPEKNWSPRALAELLTDVPLPTPLSRKAIDALCGQPSKQVKLAVRDRNRPLKALMTGALLSASARTDHPLRQLTDRSLQWDQLVRYASIRNDGSHASGRSQDASEVLEMARFTLAWHEQFKPYLAGQ